MSSERKSGTRPVPRARPGRAQPHSSVAAVYFQAQYFAAKSVHQNCRRLLFTYKRHDPYPDAPADSTPSRASPDPSYLV